MDVDLDGRTAIVTGGASGIGEACARAWPGGARVTVVDRDGEGAERVAGELRGTPVTADLTDPASLDGVELAADVLVNNAGFQHVAPVEEFPPERFAAMLALMVEALFRLARAVLPGMYERGWGRVVNISSVHGLRASPYKSAYVAAKHGLEGLSKVIALEAAPAGHLQPSAPPTCAPPGREPDRRPGPDPRHLRVRGGRAHHAHRAGHQAPPGARRGRRHGPVPLLGRRHLRQRHLPDPRRRLDRPLTPASPGGEGAGASAPSPHPTHRS